MVLEYLISLGYNTLSNVLYFVIQFFENVKFLFTDNILS